MEKRKTPSKPTIFNNNLKALRKSRGLSQRDVATAVGFRDNKMVAWYENTGSIPPFDKIVKFAEFYDVSFNFLFGYDFPSLAEIKPAELQIILGIDFNSFEHLVMYKADKGKENIKRLETINKLISNPILLDSISTILDNTK